MCHESLIHVITVVKEVFAVEASAALITHMPCVCMAQICACAPKNNRIFIILVADGWALFDTAVVSVSILLLIMSSGDGSGGNSWIKQLRVLRAFRLLRLLGKLGDLKKIVTAVVMSLLSTFQALVSLHCHCSSCRALVFPA